MREGGLINYPINEFINLTSHSRSAAKESKLGKLIWHPDELIGFDSIDV